MANEVKFKLINKLSQGLPILIKKGTSLVSRLLPSRESLLIDEAEFSQDILDKSNRGYITVEHVSTARPNVVPAPSVTVFTPAPAPAPAPARAPVPFVPVFTPAPVLAPAKVAEK